MEDLMDIAPLTFPVRYQLEVCISEGWLSEYNLSAEFVDRLRGMEPKKATALLEYVSGQKKRIYNPMDIFSMTTSSGTGSLKIPPSYFLVRSVTVTPSIVYFATPIVEVSNRVIRRYAEYSDHFLRVRFTDEKAYVSIFLELWYNRC
jgi:RNA-dependent RNA polymerase